MKIKVNKKNVGLRIRHIRLNKGYELQQFGDLLGIYKVDKSSVFGWEKGRSLPNKERIKAIAKIGDLTVNELLYGNVKEFFSNNIEEIIKKKSDPSKVEEYLNYVDNNSVPIIRKIGNLYPNDHTEKLESIDNLINELWDLILDDYNGSSIDYYSHFKLITQLYDNVDSIIKKDPQNELLYLQAFKTTVGLIITQIETAEVNEEIKQLPKETQDKLKSQRSINSEEHFKNLSTVDKQLLKELDKIIAESKELEATTKLRNKDK